MGRRSHLRAAVSTGRSATTGVTSTVTPVNRSASSRENASGTSARTAETSTTAAATSSPASVSSRTRAAFTVLEFTFSRSRAANRVAGTSFSVRYRRPVPASTPRTPGTRPFGGPETGSA